MKSIICRILPQSPLFTLGKTSNIRQTVGYNTENMMKSILSTKKSEVQKIHFIIKFLIKKDWLLVNIEEDDKMIRIITNAFRIP